MCNRRLSGEPFAHIIGRKEFFSLDFEVSRNVLIPRPETELLVELALSLVRPESYVLDLCTGTGCVAISLSINSGARVLASDISDHACALAQRNATRLQASKVIIKKSDWFNQIQEQSFDLITCNPPYIAWGDDRVADEVKTHEPHIALYCGESGLESYRIISSNAKNYLKSRGKLVLECGENQEQYISSIFAEEDYALIGTAKDLRGITRVLVFERAI